MTNYIIKPIEKPLSEDKHHGYSLMLYIGLAVMGVSIFCRTILSTMGVDIQGQDALQDMLAPIYEKSVLLFFLLTCLLIPLLEEFSYRSWTTGKRWMRWTSWAAMTIYMLMTKQWVIAGVFAVAVLLINLLVKGRKPLMWALALGTSTAFAMSHLSGFGTLDANTVFSLLQLFGLAMTLSFIGLRFHWLVGVLVHGGVNFLGMLVMVHGFQASGPAELLGSTSEDYYYVLCTGRVVDESYCIDSTHTYCVYMRRGSMETIYRSLLKDRYEDALAATPEVDTVFETSGAMGDGFTYMVGARKDCYADYDSMLVYFETLAAGMGYTLSTDTTYTDPVVITAYAIKQQ